MILKKLSQLPPTEGHVTINDAFWAYARSLSYELFPDDKNLATYGTLAGLNLLLADHTLPASESVIPFALADDQTEDWFIGYIVKGALDKNRELNETYGPPKLVMQERLF